MRFKNSNQRKAVMAKIKRGQMVSWTNIGEKQYGVVTNVSAKNVWGIWKPNKKLALKAYKVGTKSKEEYVPKSYIRIESKR